MEGYKGNKIIFIRMCFIYFFIAIPVTKLDQKSTTNLSNVSNYLTLKSKTKKIPRLKGYLSALFTLTIHRRAINSYYQLINFGSCDKSNAI